MRLTWIAALCTAVVLGWACGDGSGSGDPPPPAPAAERQAPPAPAPEPAPAPAPAEPDPGSGDGGAAAAGAGGDVAAGAAHYATYCATCHGDSGQGDGPGAQGLPVAPRDFAAGEFKFDADGDGTPGEDEDLRLVIQNGAAAYGGSPLMTPWAGVLDDQGIADVIAYVRSLEK